MSNNYVYFTNFMTDLNGLGYFTKCYIGNQGIESSTCLEDAAGKLVFGGSNATPLDIAINESVAYFASSNSNSIEYSVTKSGLLINCFNNTNNIGLPYAISIDKVNNYIF